MRYLPVLTILISSTAHAALYTIDENGINSRVTGLTGAGIQIGQTESYLPGMPTYDTNPNVYAANTFPTQRFQNGGITSVNDFLIEDHPTQVAQVMIGKDTPQVLYAGVAQDAALYYNGIQNDDDVSIATAMDFLAQRTTGGIDIKAINFSAGHPIDGFLESLDGNTHLTQYVDWSATRYDVLYVVSWPNADDVEASVPSDNFNGMTVASSGFATETDSIYSKFSFVNSLDFDADGPRTSIDILAPGEFIRLKGTANTPGGEWNVQGSSFAAPHVTGATALLQQYAAGQVGTNPRFNANSRRHEVMKAVMLNSADKLNGVHGSIRTIIDSNNQDWTQSEAQSVFVSLDDQMGAGHLNVKKAVDQLAPGEYGPGTVPLIGWDYGSIGSGGQVEYVFDQPLTGDKYIAITLCWDRRVVLTDLDNDYNSGDQFFRYENVNDTMGNLDIALMKSDGTNWILDGVLFSETFEDNVEHIFSDNFNTGTYKIVVRHNGGISPQNYALALRYGGDTTPFVPGDFDGDGDVDDDDLPDWRDSFGVDGGADADQDGDSDGADFLAWQQNLGTVTAVAIPEPSSTLLMIGAFGTLPYWRRIAGPLNAALTIGNAVR